MSKEARSSRKKTDVLQGTLDLMVLQTLDALGPLHGYGIARRIEQVSEAVLQLNEGTVYTALLRLQQERSITWEWGTSENNRRAKFYSITRTGRKQLAREAAPCPRARRGELEPRTRIGARGTWRQPPLVRTRVVLRISSPQQQTRKGEGRLTWQWRRWIGRQRCR